MGAGKSEVCRIAQTMGIPVFYSDTIARELMEKDMRVKKALSSKFGEQLYDHGRLKREWLAELIFNNPESRAFVEGIVHQAVHTAFNEWKSIQSSEIIIRESAPLLSMNLSKQNDSIILISCPPDIRISRTLQREGMNLTKFQERSRLQHEEHAIRPFAQYEIINDGRALIPQVVKAFTPPSQSH
jgi:dephospho-CoA kinase